MLRVRMMYLRKGRLRGHHGVNSSSSGAQSGCSAIMAIASEASGKVSNDIMPVSDGHEVRKARRSSRLQESNRVIVFNATGW